MSESAKKIYAQLERTIRRNQSIVEDDLVIAAISGGADSTALLDLMVSLRDKCVSFQLFAVHFDHKLRPESSVEAQLVQGLCDKFGVKLFIGSGNVADEARQQHRSEHDIARELRYKYFVETALKLKKKSASERQPIVVTAHHFDDQVETVLMRLFKGSGLSGLSGIRPFLKWGDPAQVKIFRPLLAFRHDQLVEYCQSLNLEYVIDPSNADNYYPRNNIRHTIIPAIVDNMGSAALRGIVRSAEIIRGADEYSDREIDKMLAESVCNRRRCELELDYRQYSSYLEWIRLVCIRKAANSIAGKVLRITYERCKAAEQFLKHKQGGTIEIGGGISVTCTIDRIFFFKQPTAVERKRLAVPGKHTVRDWGRLQVTVVEIGKVQLPPRPGCLFLDWSSPDDDVELAPVSSGDRISPLGMDGRRNVSDYLRDSGVPVYRRQYPAIWIGKDIAAIPPFGISERFKVSSSSVQALEIVWNDV